MLSKTTKLYNELNDVYDEYFSLKYLSCTIQEKFTLINLLALLVYKAKEHDKTVSTIDVLNKILDNKIDNYDIKFIYGLSIIVDDFMQDSNIFDTCGLKSAEEIIIRIKNIIDYYLPFGKDMPF